MKVAFRIFSHRRRFLFNVIWLSVFGSGLLIALTLFLKIDIIVQGPGITISTSFKRPIFSVTDGVVDEFHVNEGDSVEKDQLLVTLKDPNIRTEIGNIDNRLEKIGQQISLYTQLLEASHNIQITEGSQWKQETNTSILPTNLQKLLDTTQIAHMNQLREFDAQNSIVLREISGKIKEKIRIENIIELYTPKVETYEYLQKSGTLKKSDLRDAKLELEQLFLQRDKLVSELSILEANLVKFSKTKSLYHSSYDKNISSKISNLRDDELTRNSEMSSLLTRQKQLKIFSPLQGVVQEKDLSAIGQLAGKRPLLKIVPENEELILVAKIKNQDIAFTRAGQEVDVLFDAFSLVRYGTITGEIIQISRDITEPLQEIPVSVPITDKRKLRVDIEQTQLQPTYEARVRLKTEADFFEELRPGLTAIVSVKTGERTVAEFFLDPLLRAWNNMLIER